jgi:hypothetical protein
MTSSTTPAPEKTKTRDPDVLLEPAEEPERPPQPPPHNARPPQIVDVPLAHLLVPPPLPPSLPLPTRLGEARGEAQGGVGIGRTLGMGLLIRTRRVGGCMRRSRRGGRWRSMGLEKPACITRSSRSLPWWMIDSFYLARSVWLGSFRFRILETQEGRGHGQSTYR